MGDEYEPTYPEQLAAIKPKPCPACGWGSGAMRPYAGKGTRVQCPCGAITEFYEDGRDALLAWNAWAANVKKRKELSHD